MSPATASRGQMPDRRGVPELQGWHRYGGDETRGLHGQSEITPRLYPLDTISTYTNGAKGGAVSCWPKIPITVKFLELL